MIPHSQYDKTDKSGYDAEYKDQEIGHLENRQSFVNSFELSLQPFAKGGGTKGYVRQIATNKLLAAADALDRPYSEITVLDAGSGLGGLSVYLASKGFRVYGIDISESGCQGAQRLAERMELDGSCTFLAESLESISVPNESIDFVIGHASLHHFIKYDGVSEEFRRVLKPAGQGFFADAFGENKIYRLFHDKEKMIRLGDVSLTREMVTDYFKGFDVEIIPTDWFVMLDKLYLRLFRGTAQPVIRSLSGLHFWLDRRIPRTSSLALRMAGSIATVIRKKESLS